METIMYNGEILAIITEGTEEMGVNFVTPDSFPLQLGIHKQKKGTICKAHKHIPFKEVGDLPAHEIFMVMLGKIAVDIFYDKKVVRTVTLNAGDSILLTVGHRVRFLEDTQMFEVKQGPYRKNEKVWLE